MEKRLILAIASSLVIMLTWSALLPKQQPVVKQDVATNTTPPSGPTASKVTQRVAPTAAKLTFSTSKLEINFQEEQAAIQEVLFKSYPSGRLYLGNGLLWTLPNSAFKQLSSAENQITFVAADKEKELIKQFTFSDYTLDLEIIVRNLSNLNLRLTGPLVVGTLSFVADPDEARYQDISVVSHEKIVHWNGRKETSLSQVQFVSLRNRYFTAIIQPQNAGYSVAVRKINNQASEVVLLASEAMVPPGGTIAEKLRIYLGPLDLQTIKRINPEWGVVIHYGTFNFIGQLLLQLLEWLYKLAHNWGWAIVILSVLIYLLLFPLTLKQMHSMKKMQAVQPHIEELRKIYKDNPQRMNKEIMELYREHK
ncbi:MAG: membrane protein insertase YidC, partial [Candidatus Omnitrophota bacterium]